MDVRANRTHALLLALIVVLLAAFAYQRHVTSTKLAAYVAAQERVSTTFGAIDSRLDEAYDARAKSIVGLAADAMESAGREDLTFLASPGEMQAIEAAVEWTDSPQSAEAARNEVGLTATDDAFTVATRSESGRVYSYERTPSGAVTRTCGPGCSW